MNNGFKKKKLSKVLLAVTGGALIAGSGAVLAHGDKNGYGGRYTSYTLQGDCAFLPADRATEFHGNPDKADLLLGMAGNQWVVFDNVMKGFNVATGRGDGAEPTHRDNPGWTLADLNDSANNYYIQLIPPGQIRNQIKSGCMLLGNDEDRNFLPGNIQVNFDVFTSTNYNLMRDLAANGFVTEAAPYIKNKLDLMVDATNSKGIGTAGAPGTYANIYDIVMDLLDPAIVVSEVDHINEGIHNAINNMYKAMDEYIRENGSDADIKALDDALADVSIPQTGSPADTRTGITTDFNLATNAQCHYSGHPTIANGTLRFCEFAVLNKASTHETRVHHVETPSGILNKPGFVPVDVGPVWTSELKYAQNAKDLVSGMDQNGGSGGVSSPADADPVVNAPATYSITLLATAENRKLAKKFIDYVRSPDGQSKYTDGGFIGLTPEELDAGECYDLAKDGTLVTTPRVGSCPENGRFK
jgi:ABC-type molybdate transport system substrate-binding protein